MRLFKCKKKTDLIYFKESAIAHQFLDGLNGIEVGGNTQNSFGLETRGGMPMWILMPLRELNGRQEIFLPN